MTSFLEGKLGPALLAAVLALVTVCGMWLLAPGLLDSWEGSTYDARLRLRGPAPAAEHLVLIARDSESDTRFGLGIWDREMFARVITGLTTAGASVVAADFHFAGESPAERGGLASDTALIQAIKTASMMVIPVPILVAQSGSSLETRDPAPFEQGVLAYSGPTLDSDALQRLQKATAIWRPLPELTQHAQTLGHIAAVPDADGVYRHVPAYVNLGGQAFPAFGVAIAAAFLQVSADRIEVNPGKALVFRDAQFADLGSGGEVRTISLPIDGEGRLLVNYAGRWEDGPFTHFSFADIWDALEEGRLAELREQVKGKIVLLLHAGIESDTRQTPFDEKAPGGFIHANVINTIIMDQGLRKLSPPGLGLLVFILAAGAAWVLLTVPSWLGVGLVAAVAAMYLILAQVTLILGGVVAPLVLPVGALIVASGAALGWTRWTSTQKIQHLETERLALHRSLASTQELLAQQESRVERLEEDLAVAGEEAAAGVGQRRILTQEVSELTRSLAAATQELAGTRQNLQALEDQLGALQAASVDRAPMAEADKEEVRQECQSLGILTVNPVMLKLFRDLKKASRAQIPILLLGEPGTGKELFAQAAHRLSPRASGPFVTVNMAAIPPDLFESELFGHLKGAFTGAVRDHRGYFEQAQHGTIFLDEIGDLRPDLQAKLLRVLQEGTFYRVGDTRPTKVDVRVITATNRNLLQGIAQGWFREDMYFRLRGIELSLPPLREHLDDLPLLVDRLVREAATQAGRESLTLSTGALEALRRWAWKGNVRELKQCLERAVVFAEGDLILAEDLRLAQSQSAQAGLGRESAPTAEAVSGDPAVLACLRQRGFDLQATAHALGWDRSTVMQRLKGLCFNAMVEHGGDPAAAAAALAGDPSLVRVVQVKLANYVDHLHAVAGTFASAEDAIAECRHRFKNLPERYFPAVEALIRQHFDRLAKV